MQRVLRELISTQEQLPRILQVAMRSALARGGVAVVVVPGEIFLAEVRDAGAAVPIRPTAPVIRPDQASLAAAAEVLNTAGRVTIWPARAAPERTSSSSRWPGRCRPRWCTRSAARSPSSTTTRLTWG